MKTIRRFAKFIAINSVLLAVPALVQAAEAIDRARSGVDALAGKTGLQTPRTAPQIVGGIVNAVISVLGTVAVFLIMYAAGLWITAAGNEDKVSQAKTIIKQATVGLIILGLAYAITAFIVSTVSGA